MGEFGNSLDILPPKKNIFIGAFKKFYSDTTQAALTLRDLQVSSCAHNFTAGWLLWTWDSSDPQEQPELWSVVIAYSQALCCTIHAVHIVCLWLSLYHAALLSILDTDQALSFSSDLLRHRSSEAVLYLVTVPCSLIKGP